MNSWYTRMSAVAVHRAALATGRTSRGTGDGTVMPAVATMVAAAG